MVSDRRVDGRRVLITFFVVVDSIVGSRWDLVTSTAVVGGRRVGGRRVGGRRVLITTVVVVDSIVGSRWNVVTSAVVVDSVVGGRCVVVTSGVVVSLFNRRIGTFTIANSL